MNAVLNPSPYQLDAIDRQIIIATQSGLPLVAQPWDAVAEQLGLDPDEVVARVAAMQEHNVIRRIGAVPNHYALGYRANGMSVWNVPDDMVAELGRQVGDLEFVSHCYERPRHLPLWPYNLFAMVHGYNRDEVADHVKVIAGMLRGVCRGHDVLYSTRILKKTGLRIGE
ncbi:MAG: AsnC family transcriptional regulator [Gammaproteobacteria bacterium]|nr:MAG: AsnC family transcriptional regulator [Gammaproteobacteria bacterium]